VFHDTIFELHPKIQPQKILTIVIKWAENVTVTDAVQTTATSETTVTKIFHECLDSCSNFVQYIEFDKGSTIEVDEVANGKRKYNVGRSKADTRWFLTIK